MYLVTIITPFYNNKDDILNSIKSIINQTYNHWELILIDDCSTDNSYDIVKEFINDNKQYNIKLIQNEKNYGVYVSLNIGIQNSSGEFICRLDSDDRLNPQTLEKCIKVVNYYNCDVVRYLSKRKEQIRIGDICLFYRKNIIDIIGYYDSVRFGADTEFLSRMVKVLDVSKFRLIKQVLYNAKFRKNSLTTSNETGLYSNKGVFIRKLYVKNFLEWHRKETELYVPFPLIKRLFPVPEIMISNYP